MSTIEPFQPRPTPSSSSKSKAVSDDSKKKGKEFKLPDKVHNKESQKNAEQELEKAKKKETTKLFDPFLKDKISPKQLDEERKKDLFALAQEVMLKQEKGQTLAQSDKVQHIAGHEPTEATSQIQEIAKLILKMVETLHVGEIGGKSFAALNLKASGEVPPAFVGSNIILTQQTEGLSIHFDNFASPQQEKMAITLVEKNKEQLENLIQALNARNIQVAELRLGQHVITLPLITPNQSPLQQTSPAARTESGLPQREEKDQQQDQREKEKEQ